MNGDEIPHIDLLQVHILLLNSHFSVKNALIDPDRQTDKQTDRGEHSTHADRLCPHR